MSNGKKKRNLLEEILLFGRKIIFSLEVFLKLITELAVDENESEYNEGCKVRGETKGRKDEAPAVMAVASIYRICTPAVPTLPSSAV